MIKNFLSKTIQCLLILLIMSTGSFLAIEEAAEKTEKTEKAEEALHSIHHLQAFHRSVSTKKEKIENSVCSNPSFNCSKYISQYYFENYNIAHMYITSYLDIHFRFR